MSGEQEIIRLQKEIEGFAKINCDLCHELESQKLSSKRKKRLIAPRNYLISSPNPKATKQSEIMTRQEKVSEFFSATNYSPRWCTAKVCACMGCVNRYKKKEWYELFPEDVYLTKEDVDEYNRQNDRGEPSGFRAW